MQIEVGQILDGKVKGITKFGAFISLAGGKTGMVHISEIAFNYVKDISEHLKENQDVRVKVISIDPTGKIGLSIKQAEKPVSKTAPSQVDWSKSTTPRATSFEDMLSRFKADSDEKISSMKKPESRRGGYSRRNNNYDE